MNSQEMSDLSTLSLEDVISIKIRENQDKGFPLSYIFCGTFEDYEDELGRLNELN
jgi:hypothetical protein